MDAEYFFFKNYCCERDPWQDLFCLTHMQSFEDTKCHANPGLHFYFLSWAVLILMWMNLIRSFGSELKCYNWYV